GALVPGVLRTVLAGTPRRQAATSVALPQPTFAAKVAPDACACSRVGRIALQSCGCSPVGAPVMELYWPLWLIALSYRPLAVGDASWWQMLDPPADSPKMVTLFGSPPNAPMLRRTQRIAACWSWSP